jgi:hypothetical protein
MKKLILLGAISVMLLMTVGIGMSNPETFTLDDNPSSPTVDVEMTSDCEKVMWDIEIEDQGDPFCDYGHTEFGLVIGFSDDQAEFQVGTGQMFGANSPPIYQNCDGPSMTPPYGCWAGGSGPTTTLPSGIVVTNPGGTGQPGYGDRVFHVEIPVGYLNGGTYYWAVSVYGGQNYGYCKSGYQQYPTSWVTWSGSGPYAGPYEACTKSIVLQNNNVPGQGIANAPGLQKNKPNDNFAKGTANKP